MLTGPLAPEVLDALEWRLGRIDHELRADPARTAVRLEYVAQTLTGGRPEIEMFELAAALALWGRYLCALRDQAKPRSPAP